MGFQHEDRIQHEDIIGHERNVVDCLVETLEVAFSEEQRLQISEDPLKEQRFTAFGGEEGR